MKKIIFILIILIYSNLICYAKIKNEYLIVPNGQIGAIRLYDVAYNINTILKTSPDQVNEDYFGYFALYDNYELGILYDRTYKVRVIICKSTYFKDIYDLGVGSDINDVMNCYLGGSLDKDTYFCLNRGISFAFNRRNKVTGITIFDPGYVDFILNPGR
jgi:hypothetical protein